MNEMEIYTFLFPNRLKWMKSSTYYHVSLQIDIHLHFLVDRPHHPVFILACIAHKINTSGAFFWFDFFLTSSMYSLFRSTFFYSTWN